MYNDSRQELKYMAQKHTLAKLNNCSREELITINLTIQRHLDTLNENMERLIEQIRIANQQRFGRQTKTMVFIEGQLSFFYESDILFNEKMEEPTEDKILPPPLKKIKRKNPKLNNLRPYYYFKHLPTELPKLVDENGNIDDTQLDALLPWSKELPDECRKNTPQK